MGYFGRHLEAELSNVEAKDNNEGEWKRRLILERYLGTEEDKPSRGAFADPAAMFK